MEFISHHITPLVIYSLGADTHTSIHTDDLHRINFKKTGVSFGQYIHGLKTNE